MANFTGILGSTAAQPGDIIAGAGPGGGVGAIVASAAIVASDVVFEVVQGLWKRLEVDVTVASAVSTANLFNKNLVSQCSVTEVTDVTPSPWSRVTQFLVEVVYAPSNVKAKLSQIVVEVAYKRDSRQSVTSTITVSSGVNIPVEDPQTVTSTGTVAHTIDFRNTKVRLAVTNSVVVTQAIVTADTVVRLSVSNTGTAVQTIVLHGPIPDSVTDTATVSQDIALGGVRSFHVETTATVTQAITTYINPNRQSVTNTGTVAIGIGTAGVSDFISVNTLANVAQTIGVRSTVIRLSVTSNITVNSQTTSRDATISKTVTSTINVSQALAERNTNVRISVTSDVGVSVPESERTGPVHGVFEDDITVSSVPDIANLPRNSVTTNVVVDSEFSFFNTNPRITVTNTGTALSVVDFVSPNVGLESSGTAIQTISTRNTIVRLEVVNTGTATQSFIVHTDPLRISVEHTVTVKKFDTGTQPGQAIIFVSINPNRQTCYSLGVVQQGPTGGPSHRPIAMQDTVTVSMAIRTNSQDNGTTTFVFVHPSITCSPNPNRMSFQTDVFVLDRIDFRIDSLRGSVHSAGIITQTIQAQGPIVALSVKSNVLATYTVFASSVVLITIHDEVHVSHFITNIGDPNRQVLVQLVSVDQAITTHNTNTRISVEHDIVVNSSAQSDMHVRSTVTVGQKINRNTLYHILQKLDIEDDVQPTYQFVVDITQTLELDETILRTAEYSRAISNQLTFADPYRIVYVDFNDEYIPVPIVIGVKVDKYVTITAKSQTIVLPPPQFDDSQANVSSVDIKRSITGLSYVHVKRTDRRKLNWPFKLGLDKATELRLFLETAISQQITVTDWTGNQWVGFFTSNPFEYTSESRYVGQKEKISITLEFEAVKLT